jgi:hypothetical protein
MITFCTASANGLEVSYPRIQAAHVRICARIRQHSDDLPPLAALISVETRNSVLREKT